MIHHLTFPSEERVFSFLDSHDSLQEEDAKKISRILAESFANKMLDQEGVFNRVMFMSDTKKIQLPDCDVGKVFFVSCICKALQDCAIDYEMERASIKKAHLLDNNRLVVTAAAVILSSAAVAYVFSRYSKF